jgi:protein-S-isoprenylcysteine O-methyltransferase Ste14
MEAAEEVEMLRNRIMDYVEPTVAPEQPESHRIPPPLYLLGALGLMAVLNRVAPGPRIVPVSLRRFGIVGIVAGLGLGAGSVGLFRHRGTPVLPFREPKVLVTDGPYRFSRNPMYLGLTMVLAGAGWMFGTLTPLLVVPVFVGLLTGRVIRREEQSLARTFGDSYRQYASRVRRWL